MVFHSFSLDPLDKSVNLGCNYVKLCQLRIDEMTSKNSCNNSSTTLPTFPIVAANSNLADDSQPLSQPAMSIASPQLDGYLIDIEFTSMLHPVHEAPATESLPTIEAAKYLLCTLLTSHLHQRGASKQSKSPQLTPEAGSHNPRTI